MECGPSSPLVGDLAYRPGPDPAWQGYQFHARFCAAGRADLRKISPGGKHYALATDHYLLGKHAWRFHDPGWVVDPADVPFATADTDRCNHQYQCPIGRFRGGVRPRPRHSGPAPGDLLPD